MVGESGSQPLRIGEKSRPCLWLAATLGELARAVLENLLWWHRFRRTGSPTDSATSGSEPGFELALPYIYPVYDLMKHVKPYRSKVWNLHGTGQQQMSL